MIMTLENNGKKKKKDGPIKMAQCTNDPKISLFFSPLILGKM